MSLKCEILFTLFIFLKISTRYSVSAVLERTSVPQSLFADDIDINKTSIDSYHTDTPYLFNNLRSTHFAISATDTKKISTASHEEVYASANHRSRHKSFNSTDNQPDSEPTSSSSLNHPRSTYFVNSATENNNNRSSTDSLQGVGSSVNFLPSRHRSTNVIDTQKTFTISQPTDILSYHNSSKVSFNGSAINVPSILNRPGFGVSSANYEQFRIRSPRNNSNVTNFMANSVDTLDPNSGKQLSASSEEVSPSNYSRLPLKLEPANFEAVNSSRDRNIYTNPESIVTSHNSFHQAILNDGNPVEMNETEVNAGRFEKGMINQEIIIQNSTTKEQDNKQFYNSEVIGKNENRTSHSLRESINSNVGKYNQISHSFTNVSQNQFFNSSFEMWETKATSRESSRLVSIISFSSNSSDFPTNFTSTSTASQNNEFFPNSENSTVVLVNKNRTARVSESVSFTSDVNSKSITHHKRYPTSRFKNSRLRNIHTLGRKQKSRQSHSKVPKYRASRKGLPKYGGRIKAKHLSRQRELAMNDDPNTSYGTESDESDERTFLQNTKDILRQWLESSIIDLTEDEDDGGGGFDHEWGFDYDEEHHEQDWDEEIEGSFINKLFDQDWFSDFDESSDEDDSEDNVFFACVGNDIWDQFISIQQHHFRGCDFVMDNEFEIERFRWRRFISRAPEGCRKGTRRVKKVCKKIWRAK